MPKPREDIIRGELTRLRNLYEKTSASHQTLESLQDRVMDPLISFLHCSFGPMKFEEFLRLERARRIDKSISNAIGKFHETVLASISGWHHPTSGVGLICDEMKIAAEVKNKYGINADAARKTYDDLGAFLDQHEGYTTYFVTIIPKNGKINEPWSVTGKPENKKIRIVDGSTFYDIAARDEDTLSWVYGKIYEILQADDSLRATISDLLDDAYQTERRPGE